MVAERAPRREEFLPGWSTEVAADLREAKIKATVTGRPKHYYSIYQKMIVRGREFDEIYDLVGIRVLVDKVRDCYAALGAIHARWNPVPGRFKDYIAMPKFNMYQSLHTTVIGPEGKPVEMQIRTHEMHRRAEYGVAAHWKYKEDTGSAPSAASGDGDGADGTWPGCASWWTGSSETADPGEFLESLRFEIGAPPRSTSSPRGARSSRCRRAPRRSTSPTRCTPRSATAPSAPGSTAGWSPLESALDNGDVVEIFTSKAQDAGPSRDWLHFVKSARARNKIRHWFTKERREEAIEAGKDAIARAMRKQGLPLQRLATGDALVAIATRAAVHGRVGAVRGGRGTAHQRPGGGGQAGRVGRRMADAQEGVSGGTLPHGAAKPQPRGDPASMGQIGRLGRQGEPPAVADVETEDSRRRIPPMVGIPKPGGVI